MTKGTGHFKNNQIENILISKPIDKNLNNLKQLLTIGWHNVNKISLSVSNQLNTICDRLLGENKYEQIKNICIKQKQKKIGLRYYIVAAKIYNEPFDLPNVFNLVGDLYNKCIQIKQGYKNKIRHHYVFLSENIARAMYYIEPILKNKVTKSVYNKFIDIMSLVVNELELRDILSSVLDEIGDDIVKSGDMTLIGLETAFGYRNDAKWNEKLIDDLDEWITEVENPITEEVFKNALIEVFDTEVKSSKRKDYFEPSIFFADGSSQNTEGDSYGDISKVRFNKTQISMLYDFNKFKEDYDNYKNINYEAHPFIKREPKKARFVIATGWKSHLYLSVLYKILEDSFPNIDGILSFMKDRDIYSRFYQFIDDDVSFFPVDQKEFDRHIRHDWLVWLIDVIEQKLQDYFPDEHLLHTTCDAVRYVIRNTSVVIKQNGKVIFNKRAKKGLLSGWKLTNFFGSAINKALNKIANKIIEDAVLDDVAQGDDMHEVLAGKHWNKNELVKLYDPLGIIVNPAKNFLMYESTVFLRQYMSRNGCAGFPMRFITSLYCYKADRQSNDDEGIESILENLRGYISRVAYWSNVSMEYIDHFVGKYIENIDLGMDTENAIEYFYKPWNYVKKIYTPRKNMEEIEQIESIIINHIKKATLYQVMRDKMTPKQYLYEMITRQNGHTRYEKQRGYRIYARNRWSFLPKISRINDPFQNLVPDIHGNAWIDLTMVPRNIPDIPKPLVPSTGYYTIDRWLIYRYKGTIDAILDQIKNVCLYFQRDIHMPRFNYSKRQLRYAAFPDKIYNSRLLVNPSTTKHERDKILRYLQFKTLTINKQKITLRTRWNLSLFFDYKIKDSLEGDYLVNHIPKFNTTR